MPATLGVPDIVTVFVPQEPDTPVGKPLKPAPVATVVEYVIGRIAVLLHTAWLVVVPAEVNVIVLLGFTVIVPVAVALPQPVGVTV